MLSTFIPHDTMRRSLQALSILFLALGCAGPSGLVGDTGETEVNTPPSVEMMPNNECPPELTLTDGTCAIADPSAYNDYVAANGAMPTMEELLNVDDSIIEEQTRSYLTQEGRGKYYVYVNESKRIGVRAVNNVGAPVQGIAVEFEISDIESSNPRGSTLSVMRATTDQYGVAAIDVNAGSDPTYFKLMMTSSDTTTMVYDINVIQPNIVDPNGDIRTIPPAQRCSIIDLSGNYAITNYYELGRFLGDDVFNALELINRALTDPGGLIGDWIRDRVGGFIGDALRGVVRDIVNFIIT